MSVFRKSVHWLMLAVAGFGAAPLWMHEFVHHGCDHSHHASHGLNDAAADGSQTSCGHTHGTSCEDEAPQPELADASGADVPSVSLSAGDEDCWLCLHLAQSSHVSGVFDCIGSESTCALAVVFPKRPLTQDYKCPPPPRGPPSC